MLTLLLLSLLALAATGAHMDPPAPPHRLCALDTECAAVHRGVCMPSTADGAGGGVCACAPGRGWHTQLRACVTYETGTAVTVANANVTLAYGPTGTGGARFAPDLVWPAAWTCDALQCRAAEYDVTYVTWRRDAILAAAAAAAEAAAAAAAAEESPENATATVVAAANYTLSPADVWIRCAPPPAAAFLRTAAADASDPAQAAVAAWRHCASCAQWCGAHGTCDPAASAALAARIDPAQAGFVCACATGWTGARCDIATASGTGATGATPAPPLAPDTDLAYLAERAFPAYTLDRVCAADADCAGGADGNERCYIHVPETRRLRRLTRVCFCAPGMVPVHGAQVACVAAATHTVAVWGSVPAAATAATYGTAATSVAATGTSQVTTVWTNGTAVQAGLLVASQSPAGDWLITPLLLADAAVDNVTAAYARVNPYLLACALAGGGGFYVPDAGTLAPTPALAWCATCAQACGAGAVCDGVTTAAGTEAADAGVCECDAAHAGAACAACVDDATVPPNCTQTWTQCATERCSAQGHCFVRSTTGGYSYSYSYGYSSYSSYSSSSGSSGSGNGNSTVIECACDAGWAGPACADAAAPCRAANCSAHGACTTTPGVCACDAGWTGADCSISAAECRRALCTARGDCTADMRCACDAGWVGPDCEQRWCGAHGGVSVLPAAGAPPGALPTCDCAAAGGWVGDTCETDLCGVTVGLGAWSDAAGGCVCEGVYAPNTDDPTALPRCTAHRCGQYGYPVAVDFCLCNSTYAVEFDPSRMRHDTSVLCVPQAPTLVPATAWRTDLGAGAVYTYRERPAVFVGVAVTTALLLAVAAVATLLRTTPSSSSSSSSYAYATTTAATGGTAAAASTAGGGIAAAIRRTLSRMRRGLFAPSSSSSSAPFAATLMPRTQTPGDWLAAAMRRYAPR